MRKLTALPRTAALIGAFATGAVVLVGCSTSNEAPAVESSPSYSPTSVSFTKRVGEFTVNFTRGGKLPAEWPNIPAPNNGTLTATGTATSAANEVEGEQLLAAFYTAPGEESQVEAAQIKQMIAASWSGGELEHGVLVFKHGDERAYIQVVSNGSDSTVNVYQIATIAKAHEPTKTAPTAVEPRN